MYHTLESPGYTYPLIIILANGIFNFPLIFSSYIDQRLFFQCHRMKMHKGVTSVKLVLWEIRDDHKYKNEN